MPDELLPQVGNDAGEQDSPAPDKTVSELERARKDAANYRTKLRELEGKWKEAEPVLVEFQKQQDAQKSEAQRLADQVAAANKLAADNQAAAERAQKELQVTRLAIEAGVNLDLVPFLDLSKLDLTDEAKALEVLGKLATAKQTANSASNPGRTGAAGADEAELRRIFFGGGRNQPTIFGGR
jgi:hypothetical protein